MEKIYCQSRDVFQSKSVACVLTCGVVTGFFGANDDTIGDLTIFI